MSKVAVVTDTTCCLPDEMYQELGLVVVPIMLRINGKQYRDKVDISPGQFWEMFPGIKEFTTSPPSPGQFVETFREISKSHESIACVLISNDLSAVGSAATLARDIFKEEKPGYEIEIVDTRTAAGAEGFVAREAARAAKTGADLKKVVAAARGMIPKVKWVAAMDTLKYIIKSGRAPRTAVVGELFQVKPLIGQVNGTGVVENLGRMRGMPKAMKKLVDMVAEQSGSRPVHLMVHYTNSQDAGEKLKKLATAQLDCAEVLMSPYSPVMAGHTGPIISLSFYV